MQDCLNSAHFFIGTAGNNTIGEVIMSRVPSFLITHQRAFGDEQTIHAQILSEKGICDYCRFEELTVQKLKESLYAVLVGTVKQNMYYIPTDGAEQVSRLIKKNLQMKIKEKSIYI